MSPIIRSLAIAALIRLLPFPSHFGKIYLRENRYFLQLKLAHGERCQKFNCGPLVVAEGGGGIMVVPLTDWEKCVHLSIFPNSNFQYKMGLEEGVAASLPHSYSFVGTPTIQDKYLWEEGAVAPTLTPPPHHGYKWNKCTQIGDF